MGGEVASTPRQFPPMSGIITLLVSDNARIPPIEGPVM